MTRASHPGLVSFRVISQRSGVLLSMLKSPILQLPVAAFALTAMTACTGLRPLNVPGYYDTSVDSDSDSDVEPVDPGESAPLLEDFRVSQSGEDVEVTFTASDDDDDIAGGTLRLTLEGTTTSYDIPDELTEWSEGPGRGTLLIEGLANGCQGGNSLTFEGKVIDAGGNGSDELQKSLTISGSGSDVPDFGDLVGDAYAYPGGLSTGTVLCGDLSSTGHDQTTNSYNADADWIQFTPSASTTLSFALTWTAASGDYDMQLYSLSTGDGTPLASAALAGNAQPESFSVFLSTTQQYALVVRGWDGDAGDWAVTID
jgi:hypothetical protein